MQVSLPWPPRGLWPNDRNHWAAMARAKHSYRKTAWTLALQAREPMPQARLCVHMTFCPPDARQRDLDNMIAAMKAGLDGLSDAIGVDDRHFALSAEVGASVKNGAVHVTVTAAK